MVHGFVIILQSDKGRKDWTYDQSNGLVGLDLRNVFLVQMSEELSKSGS